jgi:Xaa-Pro aminopeptidase
MVSYTMHLPFIISNSEGSGQPATQYLCGFSGSDSTLIILASHTYLILDGRYWEQGAREVESHKVHKVSKVEIVKIHKDYTQKQAVEEIIKNHGLKEVHLDSRITSYATVQVLEKFGLKVIGEDGVTQKAREHKRVDEITKIKKAKKIALAAFEKLKPEIVIGATERALAAKLEYLMKLEGADTVAFETIVASGPNSALPHATVTDRKIKSTDAVIIDFGARVEGYCSDFTRTVLMPKASAKLKEIYSVVEKAQQAAIKKAILGMPLKDVDHAARQVIEKAGYGQYFTHSTGHGVGMEVHELPHVSYRSTAVLQKGHVITIEPGVYIPEVGGVRLEEMIIT